MTSASASDVKRGGVLRVLEKSGFPSLDPQQANNFSAMTVVTMIYNQLVTKTPAGEAEPSLATSWNISDDGLTYTFTIRGDVTFQDGQKMTSADVAYSLDRLKTLPTSPFAKQYAVIDSIATPSDTTVVLKLKSRFAPLLVALASPAASIVSRTTVEKYGTLDTHANGTGPFMLKSMVPNQNVELVRNPNYWQKGLPYLDGMQITFNNTPSTKVAQLKSGAVDFLYDAPAELIDQLKNDPQITVYTGPGPTSWVYFQLNQQNAALTDPDVRQALFYALNPKEMAQTCLPGTSTVLTGGFLPAGAFAGPTAAVVTQDLNKAKQLLTKAGYTGGKTLSLKIDVMQAQAYYQCISQVAQAQLQSAGVQVTLQMNPLTQFIALTNKGSYQAVIGGWGGTVDPSTTFNRSFTTGSAQNGTKISDPTIDKLVSEATQTTDRTTQAKLYVEAQAQLIKGGYVYPIVSVDQFDASSKKVHGYVYNPPEPYGEWSLASVWMG